MLAVQGHSWNMIETTVPVAAAAVLLGNDPRLSACAVRLGNRTEISLPAVAQQLGDEIAQRLGAYWASTQVLWETGAGPAVVIRRTLVAARQKDDKDGRQDLNDELAALEVLPEGDVLLEHLLGETPDVDALAGFVVTQDGNETAVTCSRRSLEWPDALGGPATPGELSRSIKVVANHAKWRHRKARRLVRLEVAVEEVWFDPEAL